MELLSHLFIPRVARKKVIQIETKGISGSMQMYADKCHPYWIFQLGIEMLHNRMGWEDASG